MSVSDSICIQTYCVTVKEIQRILVKPLVCAYGLLVGSGLFFISVSVSVFIIFFFTQVQVQVHCPVHPFSMHKTLCLSLFTQTRNAANCNCVCLSTKLHNSSDCTYRADSTEAGEGKND